MQKNIIIIIATSDELEDSSQLHFLNWNLAGCEWTKYNSFRKFCEKLNIYLTKKQKSPETRVSTWIFPLMRKHSIYWPRTKWSSADIIRTCFCDKFIPICFLTDAKKIEVSSFKRPFWLNLGSYSVSSEYN